MDIVCLQCNAVVSREPNVAAKQRFCSKPCWYAWHRGANNGMTNRIDVVCDRCGTTFQKTPRRVGARNYCGRACASADHGAKMSGERHPNWRGGAVAGRGSGWRGIRTGVIERQGSSCDGCGTSDDDHRARHGAGLHVHHRSPYRLSLDNAPDNLVALCVACHAREESAARRGFSPDDFATMRAKTERDRALGLHDDDADRMYDDCPGCGERKAKKSNRCRSCRNRDMRERSVAFVCPDCGGAKSGSRATRCWTCRTTA